MIDIPNNPTNGSTITLGTTKYTYQDGKLTPFMIKQVGTELTSPKLNVETLTEKRHPVSQKPIYLKTIDFGFLPNTTRKEVAHTITNYDYIGVNLENSYIYIPGSYGFSYTGGLSIWNNKIYDIGSYIEGPNISLATGTNRTNMKAYITVEYTKIADTSSSPVKSLYTGSLNELNLNKETHAGYRRNGKDVYQIEVDCGAMPNNTIKFTPIPNYNASYTYWVSSDSYTVQSPENILITLPYVSPTAADNSSVNALGNSIRILTGTIWSAYTETKVVLHYTK